MVVGIDIGGTNTDAAIVCEKIETLKLPNELGLGEVLKKLSERTDLKKEKIVVSTSLPLNLIVGKYHEIPTLTILIPGYGLNYSSHGVVLDGYVNHRGDVIDDSNVSKLKSVLENCKAYENIAIAGKFSVRNPTLEIKAYDFARKYFSPEKIALSYPLGELNYPLRINTTILNAKIKKVVYEVTELVRKYSNCFFYYKGDGGIIPYKLALDNPSLLYNSSAAAVALGAYYLSKVKSGVVIDIGGTTTDFVIMENGNPKLIEKVEIVGKKTLVRCVDSVSIPYGGDSLIDNDIQPKRLDKPVAFGGKHITLTDALNCIGYEIGDASKSKRAWKDKIVSIEKAEEVVKKFILTICEVVKSFNVDTIIGTGYLAKYIIPAVGRELNIKYIIPKHHEAANAVGVAISRISLTLYARYDTERGKTVYNGEVFKCEFKKGSVPEDEVIIETAKEKVRTLAKEFGAEEEDIKEVKLIYFNSYTVVRAGIKRGKIADVVVQIEPGISSKYLKNG